MPDGKITSFGIPSPLWGRFDPLCIAWDATRGVLYASNTYYPDRNDVYAFNHDLTTYKTIASLSKPHGITIGPTGTVYIADPRSSITTVATDGTRGTFGSGLLGPMLLAECGTDLIVSDYFGVRRMGPSGPVQNIDSNTSFCGLARDGVLGAIYLSTNPGLYKFA